MLTQEESETLLTTLEKRFAKHAYRHAGIAWQKVDEKLRLDPSKLGVLQNMELTGGEPDVVGMDAATGEYIFCDCSAESPKGRRSLCYDRAALDARKEHKPANSALDLAAEMGVEILDEQAYRELFLLEKFDQKTSSWLLTPADIRKLGGAIFADYRYGKVFVYHNGADSYYGVRGFRASLRV
jgi:hypothetical protein